MEPQIANWYVKQWLASAFHVYQSKGFTLKNTVMPPIKVMGEQLYFRKVGKLIASESVQPGDVAEVLNLERTNIALSTSKSQAFTEVNEDDMDLTQLNLPQINAEAASMALGRVHDKLIIDTMEATAGIAEVGAFADGLTPFTLLQAKQKLMAANVPTSGGDIFAAVDSISWAVLSTFKEFNTQEWTGPNLVYVNGSLARSWNGIHVFAIDDALLPRANTTEQKCFMWHRPAIGFGTLYEMKGTVQWNNYKSCWSHNLRQRYGATALQKEGIVRMKCKYDATEIAPAA